MNIHGGIRCDDRIRFDTDTGQIHVQALGDSIMRVRYTRETAFSTPPSLMGETLPTPTPLALREIPSAIVLSTPLLTLTIERDSGRFTWRDRTGRLPTRQPRRRGMSLVPTEVM